MKKCMVVSDIHGSFRDSKALDIALKFSNIYEPDTFIINGDLLDFYSISKFDKNPYRKYDVQRELNEGKEILRSIRQSVPQHCNVVLIKGNHEDRLNRFLWANPELINLDVLKLSNLLSLEEIGVEFIDVSGDYWKTNNGHYIVNDMLIMHGDGRLNGATTSRYSGYSAKNTMLNMQSNVIIGHNHRLGLVKHTSPYRTFTGMECGCLCMVSGTANWQQGFATFEHDNEKSFNHIIHHIDNHILYYNGKKITSRKKNIIL